MRRRPRALRRGALSAADPRGVHPSEGRDMSRVVRTIFDVIEVYIAAAVFALLVVAVVVQVFMRYVLIMPSPGLFEISVYCFIWIIYLGGALACRFNQHVRFDIVFKMLPPKVGLWLDNAFHLVTNAVLLILLYPATRYTIEVYKIKSSALRIPWTFLLIVYPVFILLVLIHNFTIIVMNIRRAQGKEVREEVPPWQ
jgi:TRAP-type transport system small permease protein